MFAILPGMLERKLFAFKFNDEWECMYTVADVTRTEEKSGHIDVVLIGVQQQWNATAELMKLPPQPYQNWKLSGWRDYGVECNGAGIAISHAWHEQNEFFPLNQLLQLLRLHKIPKTSPYTQFK